MKKILIVEDQNLFREIITYCLSEYEVTEAITGEEAIEAIRLDAPDLILLDLGLPGLSGMELIETIKKKCAAPIIIMTASKDETSVKTFFRLVDSYIFKDMEALEDLKKRISDLLLKKQADCPGYIARILTGIVQGLSRRESEILSCLKKGMSSKAIANALFISIRTVDNHCRRIYEKLGIRNKIELLAKN